MGFGASSLDFEVVYFFLSNNYNEYADVQQKINLDIMQAFEEEQIQFAFPTQTLIMQRSYEHSGKLGKSAAAN
jgi:small-conductance mechanosensitive channel